MNDKYAGKNLLCVDELKEKVSKTKEFAKILSNLKLEGKILALLDGCDASVLLASRNIRAFNIKRAIDVNAHDVLLNKKLLVTRSAFKNLLKRVQSK